MKIRVADYIADFLAKRGNTQVFSVVGGGSMFLNDALGHHPRLQCVYTHHEQSAAMAAEGYARVHNQMATVCVTSGPGATNAITGVVGAYQDSIPMLVLSGQAKTGLCIATSGLPIRTVGGQEVNIVPAVRNNMVKYAEMVMQATDIRRCLEKAYAIATSGRPGPCWLDIPLDIQGTYIDAETLEPWDGEGTLERPEIQQSTLTTIIDKLRQAKRPVFYAGNGIRWAGGVERFRQLVHRLGIPVVTCWDSIDLIATDDPLYCGRGGNMGDRAGNFAVQNSDFLLCVGSRLNIYQVGWHVEKWARAAYVVDVDIDPVELEKKIMHVELPVCADAKDFMNALYELLDDEEDWRRDAWVKQCNLWKKKYPVVREEQKKAQHPANVYAFLDILSRSLPENALTVVANGSASVCGSQTYYVKAGDRFLMNCALSSMGYGLPAAIGACIAKGKQNTVCIEGDGSIMMNLQELQTVVTNRLPLKVFIINNNGYHQVRQTQQNIFHDGLIGMGPESGDLGFPDFSKIADAFGMPYHRIDCNEELQPVIRQVLQEPTFAICEVMVSVDQRFEPKSSTKRRPDGTLVSPPLEDMAPFLPKEELQENMFIPLLPEE